MELDLQRYLDVDTDPDFEHDSWKSVIGVGLGYGAIVVAMFVLLFVIPYLVFVFL